MGYDWRDFKAQHGGYEGARAEFERACETLVRRMHPGRNVQQVRANPGDHGIDIYVGQLGVDPIIVHQCKFFLDSLGKSQKNQIRSSFARALNSSAFQLEKWVLCLPMTLDVEDNKWWSHFLSQARAQHQIDIELLNGDQLLHEMRVHGMLDDVFPAGAARSEQPPVRIKLLELNPETRFIYSARRVSFVGRERELGELARFMGDPRPFLWWAVTGRAGSGKSRLALEHCLRQEGWQAGFLPLSTMFDAWETWQPAQPTLIVIDYASNQPELLHSILFHSSNRDEYRRPVRVLLLERDKEGPWIRTVEGAGSPRAIVRSARYGEPLEIGGLERDDLRQILEAVVEDAGGILASTDTALADLEAVDRDRRPLLAAFFAEARALGPLRRGWDASSLVREVLEREVVQRWQPAGITDEEQNLRVLATMVGGLPVARLEELVHPERFPEAGSFSAQRYRRMSGQDSSEFLAPLEPDILGELFVLQHLAPAHALDAQRAADLCDAAWEVSPEGMAGFLARVHDDYPGDPLLGLLTRPPTNGAEARALWASRVASHVVFLSSFRGREAAASANAVFNELVQLAQDFPDEPALARAVEYEAQALSAALSTHGMLDELREIRRALGPRDGPDPVYAATTALNLVSGELHHGTLEGAEEAYAELASISAANPEGPRARFQQAKAALQILDRCVDSDERLARRTYAQIAALADRNPTDPELRVFQARGAVVLALGYLAEENVSDAAEMRRELLTVRRRIADDPALLEMQALVDASLAIGYLLRDDVDRARELVREARASLDAAGGEPRLESSHTHRILMAASDEDGIAAPVRRFLQAAHSLAIAAAKADRMDIALEAHQHALALLAPHAGVSSLTELVVDAAFLVGLECLKARHIEELVQLHAFLFSQALSGARDPNTRKHHAMSAYNTLGYWCAAGDLDAARAIYEEFRELALRGGETEFVRYARAKAAAKIVTTACSTGVAASAEAAHRDLTAMATLPNATDATRDRLASSVRCLVEAHCAAGDPDLADRHYGDLETLIGGGDASLDVVAAECALTLLVAYGERRDFARLAVYGERLVRLGPGSPELRSLRSRAVRYVRGIPRSSEWPPELDRLFQRLDTESAGP